MTESIAQKLIDAAAECVEKEKDSWESTGQSAQGPQAFARDAREAFKQLAQEVEEELQSYKNHGTYSQADFKRIMSAADERNQQLTERESLWRELDSENEKYIRLTPRSTYEQKAESLERIKELRKQLGLANANNR